MMRNTKIQKLRLSTHKKTEKTRLKVEHLRALVLSHRPEQGISLPRLMNRKNRWELIEVWWVHRTLKTYSMSNNFSLQHLIWLVVTAIYYVNLFLKKSSCTTLESAAANGSTGVVTIGISGKIHIKYVSKGSQWNGNTLSCNFHALWFHVILNYRTDQAVNMW